MLESDIHIDYMRDFYQQSIQHINPLSISVVESRQVQNVQMQSHDENELYVVEALDNVDQCLDAHSSWSSWNPRMLRYKTSTELTAEHSEEELSYKDVRTALTSNRASTSKAHTHEDVQEGFMDPPNCTSTYKTRSRQSKSNLRKKRLLSSTNFTQLTANNRNKTFIDLAKSKTELVEMMKEDMRIKSKLEIQILEAELKKELLEVKLLEKELALKDAFE